MASAAEQLAANFNFGAFSKATELKKRIWFTLGALVVYRLGTYIPLPGIDAQVLRDVFSQQQGGIIGMLEVVESDFSKNLAEGSAAEAMAQEAYLPFLLRPPARLADGRFNPLLSKLAQ